MRASARQTKGVTVTRCLIGSAARIAIRASTAGWLEAMAHPSEESLNELFSTLAEWNARLAEVPPDIFHVVKPPEPPSP